MPKQKSHGGISKKIKVRVGGTTKIGRPGGNHNTGKKNTNFNRKNFAGNIFTIWKKFFRTGLDIALFNN